MGSQLPPHPRQHPRAQAIDERVGQPARQEDLHDRGPGEYQGREGEGGFHSVAVVESFFARFLPMSLRGLRGALLLGWHVKMATTSSV